MQNEIKSLFIQMYEKQMGEEVRSINALPQSGSYREYYRITGREKTALGVYNADEKENKAFFSFTDTFYSAGLKVPEVYEISDDQQVYLLEDLGDVTLFAFLQGIRKENEFPEELVFFYKKVIVGLVNFQIKGADAIDYSNCYPRHSFDRQSMLWDLHYFKYYFLKLARISFDEQLLEDDFNRFCDFLLEADSHYFMYRDFQSRNVMVVDDEPYFIDYQGGRKGALQYDIASLLFDAKANIPNDIRQKLLDYYLGILNNELTISNQDFTNHYWGFVLIRLMQAMGAYGFRGFYEKKEHFLQSIPLALKNLEYVLEKANIEAQIPVLFETLKAVTESKNLKLIATKSEMLTIFVTSFSYKRGIPIDITGNGGGYVFDCRSIHNPGRYPEYFHLTGKDDKVVNFLRNEPEMESFLKSVFELVDQSVEKYISRKFKHLMVNFGCTGGQHRSVYSVEQLAKHLKDKYQVNVVIKHVEQDMKK